jgi:MscS family membrane protein
VRIFSLFAICLFLLRGQVASAADTATNANPTNANTPAQTNAPAATNGLLPLITLTDQQIDQLTFGLDKIPALQAKLLGIELWQYLASLIYIFLAFTVARLLDYLISVQLRKWASKTTTKLDDLFVELAHTPIKVISFVIFLHIGLQVFRWPAWLELWISRALQLVVAVSLTYMLLRLVDIFIVQWRKRNSTRDDKSFNEQLFPIISKTLKVFIVVIAALVTSQNLGLNITGVLASLSVGGLALGLAAQDTVANLFGAVAVFADKPFQIGDTIKLENIEGVVESIGLRSTRIRNPDGFLITVPNKTMGNATITNVTRRPTIRTVMDIGLTYDTSPEKMRRAVEIIKNIFQAHPKTKDLIVAFNQFAASSLNIRVIHQWGGLDYKAYMTGLQELNLQVQERFETEKIAFAFPTQTIYMKQDSPWNLSLPEISAELNPSQAPPSEKQSQ